MISQSVSRNSIILGIFAIITTGMVVLTANLTKDKIAEEKANALKRSLFEVMSKERLNNDLLNSSITLKPDGLLGNKQESEAYVAKLDQDPAGIIVQVVAPEGYGGSINMLVGIYSNGEVSGVRVIPPHFETPGLGDAIDIQKSDWIKSFNGKSLNNLNSKSWKVKKDGGEFDAFTGATITPRAVVHAVYKSLQYFEQNETKLLYGQPEREANAVAETTQEAPK